MEFTLHDLSSFEMYEKFLQKIREKIRTRQFVMTLHAVEEMEDDQLSIFDVESCILTGKISERQRDISTNEWKYMVNGEALNGDPLYVVVKLSPINTLVIITVYRE